MSEWVEVSPQTVAYAVRYCLSRQSYALMDGLHLAWEHWNILDDATKRDVIEVRKRLGLPVAAWEDDR